MNLSLDARSQRFLADLDRITLRQGKVERQISSGYAVSNPSDGAEHVIDILQLRSDVAHATYIGTNLDRVRAEVDTGEAALQVAVNLVERARTIAAQAATSTAENRPGLAQEVLQLHQQLVDLTRTSSEGRFVFSGDLDQTQLYSVDTTQAGGIARNALTTNTRQIEDVHGSRFAVARSASEIFDTRNPDDSFASDNSFNAVWQLAQALQNDDPAAAQDAGGLLTTSLEHLGRQLTFYGNVQNRVADAKTMTQNAIIARRQELSQTQDTDLPSAILELSTLKVHHEAALGAQSQRQRTSLFDYLG